MTRNPAKDESGVKWSMHQTLSECIKALRLHEATIGSIRKGELVSDVPADVTGAGYYGDQTLEPVD